MMRKPQIIKGGHPVKVQKFIINGDHLIPLIPLGDQTGDFGLNADGTQIFQDADPFVALLYKVAVDIFIDLDGFPNAFSDMGFIEFCPFCAEFRIFWQQRHKVSCEGIAPGSSACTKDLIDRNFSGA